MGVWGNAFIGPLWGGSRMGNLGMFRRFRSLGVAHKITILMIAALVALAATVSAAITAYVSQSLEHMAAERLEQNLSVLYAVLNPRQESFHMTDGRLMLGDIVLDGDNDVLDAVVGAVGGVATIFKGDLRVATTLVKDGQRAVGTRLAAGPAYDTVLKDGYRYNGEVDILGQRYMAVYEPIADDATGNPIGALFVGVPSSEFQAVSRAVASIALAIGAVAALVLSVLAFVLSRRMLRPFGPLTRLLDDATHGNYPDNVPHTGRGDEFGALARAIGAFGDAMRGAEHQRTEQEEHERAAIAQRKAEMRSLADSMDAGIQGAIAAIHAQVAGLGATARLLLDSAEGTSERASAVAGASQTASANVQVVAAATHQLSGSSGEIGRQAEHSSSVAAEAASRTAEVGSQIGALVEAAKRIDEVVELINGIAGQTNLLALNATIEAARAGEAGKGFAVVAAEVKALANQTARATEDIVQQVATIQKESANTAGAIDAFGGIVASVQNSAESIAVAIRQQNGAIDDISRNVQAAATGTGDITGHMELVSRDAAATRSAAAEVTQAASALGDASAHMEQAVRGMIERIRMDNAA